MATLAEDVPVAHGESVVDLLRDGDRVSGVVTEGPGGRARVEADLVVACDGRESAVRDMAGIEAAVSPLNDAYLTSSARWRPSSSSASATCRTAG